MKRKILIVEDNVGLSQIQKDWLSRAGYDAVTAMSEPIARSLIRKTQFDLILSDVRLPEGDGISLLEWLRKEKKDIPFIITTEFVSVPDVVRTIKLGARDYLPKPVHREHLLELAEDVFHPVATVRKQERQLFRRISPMILKVEKFARLVAPSDMSVMILGANGTGKESVAQTIHDNSERYGKPFVAVNCGALPRELAASLFFGHEKGAFTGADTAKTYASGAVFMDRNLGALATDCTQAAAKGLYYQWGRKDPFPYPALATDAYTQAPTVYAPGFEYAESNPRTSGTESPYDVMTLEWATAHPTTYMDGVFYEDWEEWTSVADWLYVHHPNLWGNVTTGKNNISRTSHKSIYDPCPPGWKVPGAEDFAGIERIGVSAPYYVTIRCNSTQTAKIPLGGTFYEGRYDRNGSLGRLYTNAPYYLHWGDSTGVFHDVACTSILFDTSNYPPFVNTTDFYRYAANPVRCIRE